MKKFILPDFTHSNINISATLAEFLGAPNNNATLPILKEELAKGYKNVVFICFDGMGIYPLKQNLNKSDFLWKHTVDTLVSTFPSTTTCATTSLTTNRLPLEHGWLGWSVYFESIKRNINIFINTDSWTNEPIDIADASPLSSFGHYFNYVQTDYEINTIFPPYVKAAHPENNVAWNFDMNDFFEHIKRICNKQGRQFIYAYNNEPDHSMHLNGVTGDQARGIIRNISHKLECLAEETPDTLFIVTADHGQIDVAGFVELYKDEILYDMLEIYPYLEPRAIAFKVKPERKKEFEKYFPQKYGEDFTLFTSRELIERGFFGDVGDKAPLLGDYIAIGTYTHKAALFTPDMVRFKGHHTSLTEEMEVPLILIKNK